MRYLTEEREKIINDLHRRFAELEWGKKYPAQGGEVVEVYLEDEFAKTFQRRYRTMSKIGLSIYNADKDEYEEIEINARWTICNKCDGDGVIIDPAIEDEGITVADISSNPAFEESFLKGEFHKVCPKCDGEGKVLVPNPIGDKEVAIADRWLATRQDNGDAKQRIEQERKFGA